MIDLSEIVEKIQKRLDDLGTKAAIVSLEATGSKDTIRNWERAVEADRENGTNKASATTIKLNQIEAALGIELARNSASETTTPEARLRAALLAYGVDRDDLGAAMKAVKGFAADDGDDEQSRSGHLHGQSAPANRPRVKAP